MQGDEAFFGQRESTKRGPFVNSKTKRRMIVVAGIIAVVVIVLLAVVGGGSSAKVVSVSDLATNNYPDKKVQVSGLVVANSYEVDQSGVLTFDIEDENNSGGATVHVSYDKGVSATFGNGIKAICTGRMDENGTLVCSDLVTQCPSKYEKASDALTVSRLVGYGSTMYEKTTKVAGIVQAGTLGAATQSVRFVLQDDETAEQLSIVFEGALSDQVKDGAQVVVTGALSSDGSRFLASDVALGA